MRKRYFLILSFFILPLVLSFAQDEEITITTYYPSPFGVYRNLRVTDSRDLQTNDLNPIMRVENLTGTLESPTTIGGGVFKVTVCANASGAAICNCSQIQSNPSCTSNCTQGTTVIDCQREYRPAMTVGQVDDWTLTGGNLGLLAYASHTGSGGYGVDASGNMTLGGHAIAVPWPADQVAIMGISGSTGVYGISAGAHPGVIGYSEDQYGVQGIIGSSGVAAVYGEGKTSYAFMGQNANDARSAVYAINWGKGPSFGAWKKSGVGGYLADFNFAGMPSTTDNDYGIKVDVAGAVGIRSRSDDSAAIFATDQHDEQWYDFMKYITSSLSIPPGLISIHRNNGSNPAFLSISNNSAPSAVFMNGNVGIGTATPQSPAPNGNTNNNLDVNDIYLRSTGKWASEQTLRFVSGRWDTGACNQTTTINTSLNTVLFAFAAMGTDSWTSGWGIQHISSVTWSGSRVTIRRTCTNKAGAVTINWFAVGY